VCDPNRDDALFSANPLLTRLNDRSLLSPKVQVVNADAFLWVDSAPDVFDFIVVDLPDPTNYSLGKLYTTVFFGALGHHLREHGAFVVQSTSPMFARKSFWCIDETVKQAGYRTFPYHAYVPSFGEWGFVMASRDTYTPPTALPAGLRFLETATLLNLFDFLSDMARLDARQPSQRSGAGAHARVGMARNQPLTPHAASSASRPPRRSSVCRSRAIAALSGSSTTTCRRPHTRARTAVGAATNTVRIPIVVVGGGMAGLSAAWRLQKRGFDLSSRWKWPPRPAATCARPERDQGSWRALRRFRTSATFAWLFAELVLKPDGTWDERHLCMAQQERLFIHGRWQEGIELALGPMADDREQFRRFGEMTAALRASGRFGAARQRPFQRG
jgi:hypothetical protein